MIRVPFDMIWLLQDFQNTFTVWELMALVREMYEHLFFLFFTVV